jgi:hypothetical protein
VSAAALAVGKRLGWRELVGLRPEDAGSPVERVLAAAVLDVAVEAHNRAIDEAEAEHG